MPPSPPRFPALILAGENPGNISPLALDEGAQAKCMVEVGGRPMIHWVIDAARMSARVSDATIMGAEAASAGADPGVRFLPSAATVVDNVMAGMRGFAARAEPPQYVLVMAGDTPLVTPEIVTWFVDACAPYDRDLYYGIVKRETVEVRFPQSKRTYLRTREGRYCGADLFLVRPEVALRIEPQVRGMVERRKSPIAQARLVGFGWVIKLALGMLHLDEAIAGIERFARLTGRVVVLPFADAAMDVDKPFQLAMVRHAMAARQAADRP